MTPAYQVAVEPDREQLLQLWVDVTNAGGSVGFVPPAPVDLIAAQLDAMLARVAAGTDLLGVLTVHQYEGTDRLVGMGVLVDPDYWLFPHWRTVSRLMVHPSLQGTGAGSALLSGLHGSARELGLEQLQLAVRSGEGLEPFYERHGYREVGRWPGSLRLPGGDRDSVLMQAQVSPAAPTRGSAVT